MQSKGFTFDEQGHLLLDTKADTTTTLDLSGTNISVDELQGLTILPSLTDVNLANNSYKMSFDFSKLPSQITGVDLRGNELYEYKGLANTDNVENTGYEATVIQHNLKKLYLPAGARYDEDQIVAFYEKNLLDNNTIDMKMADDNGSLVAYNTLRNVPDASARKQLYTSFSELFTIENGDTLIDISKRLISPEQRAKTLMVWNCSNTEGFEYIAMNKSFQGTAIALESTEYSTIPYLKLHSNIAKISFEHLNMPNGLELSEDTDLYQIGLMSCNGIDSLDLSASKLLGQRDLKLESTDSEVSTLDIEACPDLKSIIFPAEAKYCDHIYLYYSPNLTVDLSQFESTKYLRVVDAGNVTYPDVKYYVYQGKEDDTKGYISFGITQDILEKESTLEFIKKNYDHLRTSSVSPNGTYTTRPKYFNWKSYYDKNYKNK